MYKTYKTAGIIIKRRNYSETDKLITLLTSDSGKVILRAKGIRNINSRRVSHLDLLRYTKINVYKGRTYDLITEVETIETFQNLRSNLDFIAHTYEIIEIIDRLCPENEKHYNIFKLLLGFLINIDNGTIYNIEEEKYNLIIHVLWDTGYLPSGKKIPASQLDAFIENIIEKKLKSKVLLTKIKLYII